MNGKLKKDKIDVIHLWRRYNTLHLRQKGGLFSLRQTLYGNPLDEDKLHSAKPGRERPHPCQDAAVKIYSRDAATGIFVTS